MQQCEGHLTSSALLTLIANRKSRRMSHSSCTQAEINPALKFWRHIDISQIYLLQHLLDAVMIRNGSRQKVRYIPKAPKSTAPAHQPKAELWRSPAVIQYRVATVPKEANTQPDSANMGLFSVVSRVPKMAMRAGDRMSARVPLTLLEALQRN